MKRRYTAVKKTAKHRRGMYTNLEDVIDAFSVYHNTSGWVLHKYEDWICFAIHSTEFEDPDIKVIVKTNLDYKVIVSGWLLDTRMPSLTKNEIKSILTFAERSLSNMCCGLSTVEDGSKFYVIHRRYSYDVFETPPEKPRYHTVYRSPYCQGQSTGGPCSFCYKLDGPIVSPCKEKTEPSGNSVSPSADTLNLTCNETLMADNSSSIQDQELVEKGLVILKHNNVTEL